MLTLSRVYLRADQPKRGPEALEELAESIRKSTRSVSKRFFRRHGIKAGEVVLAREGSIEIIVIVTTRKVFIHDHRRIKGNLNDLLDDARDAGEAIQPMIVKRLQVRRDKIEESRVTTGHPGQLEGLRKRVAQGRMTNEDAHKKAVDLFERGTGVDVSKDLSGALLKLFEEAAKEVNGPPPPGPNPRPIVPPPRRSFRRWVELERKPGEEKVWRRASP